MARNLSTSDLIQVVNPAGVSLAGSWMFGIMVNMDTIAADGTAIFKIGDNSHSTFARGYIGYPRGADGNAIILRAHNGQLTTSSTGIVTGTWVRLVFSAEVDGGLRYIKIFIDGVQRASTTIDAPTGLSTGDALSIGYGFSSLGMARMDGSAARAWWLQGTILSVADADAIFDDFDAAIATYGSALKVINYIEGAADPEPDYRTPGTNDLDVTGTVAVDDPLGIPGGGPTTHERSLTEGLEVGDAYSADLIEVPQTLPASVTEGLELGDALSVELIQAPQAFPRSLTEGLRLGDGLSRRMLRPRAPGSEGLSLGDSYSAALLSGPQAHQRSMIEGLRLGDAATVEHFERHVAASGEGLMLGDATSAVLTHIAQTYTRGAAEGLRLGDAYSARRVTVPAAAGGGRRANRLPILV